MSHAFRTVVRAKERKLKEQVIHVGSAQSGRTPWLSSLRRFFEPKVLADPFPSRSTGMTAS